MVLLLFAPTLASRVSYCSFAMATRLVWSSISLVRLSVFLVISSSTVAVSPPVTSHSAYSPVALDISVLLAFSWSENALASVSASDLPVLEALDLVVSVGSASLTASCAFWYQLLRMPYGSFRFFCASAFPCLAFAISDFVAFRLLPAFFRPVLPGMTIASSIASLNSSIAVDNPF